MSISTDAPPSPEALDQADMAKLQSGYPDALNDLMARHATPIFHFLCRMVGNEDDANDLAQETFVRVFKSCNSFRAEQKFSSWLFTIAANLARNQYRWRARHPQLSLDAENPVTEQSLGSMLPSAALAPNETALASERATAVRVAVQALPEDLRAAIVLCEWEERSVAEAATILEASPKAVESRLYRARHVLRERQKSWL